MGEIGTVLISSDATTWAKSNSGTTNSLFSITFGNSRFVASGSFTALISPDGTTWTCKNSGTSLGMICYNSQFVAVGYSGICISPDGITWTSNNSGQSNILHSLADGDGQLIAVGDYGTILSSKTNGSGVIVQTEINTANSSRIKLKVTNNIISAIVPYVSSRGQLKVGLFTLSGKRIYSATARINNGILDIPAVGFPAGRYFLSITDGSDGTRSSAFVLTR